MGEEKKVKVERSKVDEQSRTAFATAMDALRFESEKEGVTSELQSIIDRWIDVQGSKSPDLSEADLLWLNDRVPKLGFEITYASGDGLAVTDRFTEPRAALGKQRFPAAEEAATWHFLSYVLKYLACEKPKPKLFRCVICKRVLVTVVRSESRKFCSPACKQKQQDEQKRQAKKAKKKRVKNGS